MRQNMQQLGYGIRFIIAALALTSGLLAGACCELPRPDTPPANLDELVAQQVGYLVDARKITGAAVGVVVDGETHTYFFGETKLDSGIRPDANTYYEIGSITKTMTSALLAMALAEEDGLILESPVEPLMPAGIPVPASGDRLITVGDLASHVSSLPRLPDNLQLRPHDPYADYTLNDLRQFLASYTLPVAPGTRYEYSNLGASILGMALANRAGVTYAALLNDRLLGPLGMSETVLEFTDAQRARLAAPYQARLIEDVCLPPRRGDNWDLGLFAPAGGVKSTLNDMLKYLAANMTPEGTALESAAPVLYEHRVAVNAELGVALGWHIINATDDFPDIVWHNGGTGGYNTFTGFFRGTRTGIVLLTNTAGSPDTDGAALGVLRGIKSLPTQP